jgi:hypothetical protein
MQMPLIPESVLRSGTITPSTLFDGRVRVGHSAPTWIQRHSFAAAAIVDNVEDTESVVTQLRFTVLLKPSARMPRSRNSVPRANC